MYTHTHIQEGSRGEDRSGNSQLVTSISVLFNCGRMTRAARSVVLMRRNIHDMKRKLSRIDLPVCTIPNRLIKDV